MKSTLVWAMLILAANFAVAADPAWIWSNQTNSANDALLFRREFTVPEDFGSKLVGKLQATCDNRMVIWLNGKRIGVSDEWEVPISVDASKALQAGKNTLMIEGRNDGGPAGLLVRLTITNGKRSLDVLTDRTWQVQPFVEKWNETTLDAKMWRPAEVVARYGDGPWGAVFSGQFGSGKGGSATPAESLVLLPGFRAELLYSVPKADQGSWVNMCFDPKGRLIVSNQNGLLYRVTLDQPNRGEVLVEPIEVRTKPNAGPIGKAHGLCVAFGALYVMVADGGGEGNGLYRLRDTNGDDQYDSAELLMRLQGGGEHGPHAVRLAPDGKSLYVIAGNHTKLPAITSSRVPQNWGEDQLLPRMNDAGGHAAGVMAPGGWICRIDPDARDWELVCCGFRNQFDIDFNGDGELFTYDSDMEWDVGLPWYRPTRINHCVSGAEFGWRHGSGKWPDYYPDGLPATANVGLGSPTGVSFGTGARFPAKYQRAFYILDWTYGHIYAAHLYPNGSTYLAELERFVSGKPLPVTDVAIGPDGAMYFTIGGRGTQSGLYRVTYSGKDPTEPAGPASNDPSTAARGNRRTLEQFHGKQDPRAVEAAWPYLSDRDRFVRYAARIAIEHQPVDRWRQRALELKEPQAVLTAMLALVRSGKADDGASILERLNALDWTKLNEMQRLEAIRIYSLVIIRFGRPARDQIDAMVEKVSPHFPSKSYELNRELSALLVSVEASGTVEKTLKLMLASPSPAEQIAFAYNLRTTRSGWTPAMREQYFKWFTLAANHRGGASFAGYIRNVKADAVASLNANERSALAAIIDAKPTNLKSVDVKPRPVVREWTQEELRTLLEKRLMGRDFSRGRAAFTAAQCIQCHRFAGDGGASGPDLTGVSGRFSIRDLLDATVEPSKVISDQYQSTVLHKKDGKAITGRIVNETDQLVRIIPDPLKPDQIVNVPIDQIESREPSPVSSMPIGLLNILTEDEILDLFAYLLSAGDRSHPAFK